MFPKIRVFLVDDHEVVRKGMKFLLEDEDSLEIVGEASGGREAVATIPQVKPELVLLDINMPEMNGIEVAKVLRREQPAVRILIFSMHNDADYVLKSIESGVDGYAEREEIVKAIKTVHGGEKYFPPEVSALLVSALQGKGSATVKRDRPRPRVVDRLSKKELEILRFISNGMSSKDIAEKLELSIRTVSNHRANMLKKTGLNNTAELIRMVTNEGF